MQSYREKINYLNQYFYATKSLEGRYEELARWQDLGTKLSSVSDGMPHAHDNSSSKVENAVIGLADLEQTIREEIKGLEIIREEVYDVINSMPNYRHRMILSMRYLDFMSFSRIADAIGKTENNVYKLHKQIIQRLDI